MPHHIIYLGNALDVLRQMPDESVDCIITSPPYWALRDYSEATNTIWGGNSNCEHEFEIIETKRPNASGGKTDFAKSSFCKKCGAWYGQLGLEPTLDMYIEHMLQITAELKRVLKKTGVMFWNHGDCYGGNGTSYKSEHYSESHKLRFKETNPATWYADIQKIGVKPKCIALQNYRLILRMIDEQCWILRNVIIWHKPNVMPSSVKDRFGNKYEQVFMLTKSKKYWFDLDAVRVPHKEYKQINKWDDEYWWNFLHGTSHTNRFYKQTFEIMKKWMTENNCYNYEKFYKWWCEQKSGKWASGNLQKGQGNKFNGELPFPKPESRLLGKNPGDVWTIPSQPFPETHFATYPEKLVEPMIKASCPRYICCACGKARVRITKTQYEIDNPNPKSNEKKSISNQDTNFKTLRFAHGYAKHYTIGWTDCGCGAGWRPGIVLDPFVGSGTTMLVAEKLGRDSIGIELNPDYVKLVQNRLKPYLMQTKLNREKSSLDIIKVSKDEARR